MSKATVQGLEKVPDASRAQMAADLLAYLRRERGMRRALPSGDVVKILRCDGVADVFKVTAEVLHRDGWHFEVLTMVV